MFSHSKYRERNTTRSIRASNTLTLMGGGGDGGGGRVALTEQPIITKPLFLKFILPRLIPYIYWDNDKKVYLQFSFWKVWNKVKRFDRQHISHIWFSTRRLCTSKPLCRLPGGPLYPGDYVIITLGGATRFDKSLRIGCVKKLKYGQIDKLLFIFIRNFITFELIQYLGSID